MERFDKRKAISKIHAQAREMRGEFLNDIACIERDIALILTDYFCTSCKDKRKIFYIQIFTLFIIIRMFLQCNEDVECCQNLFIWQKYDFWSHI